MKRTLGAISWLLAAAILAACAGTRDDEQQPTEETIGQKPVDVASTDVARTEADKLAKSREGEVRAVAAGEIIAKRALGDAAFAPQAPPGICCVYQQPANTE